jgi:hypothetical protein
MNNADLIKITVAPNVNIQYVGTENTPILVIDNFTKSPELLVELAGDGADFIEDKQNFYPGKRKPVAMQYRKQLCDIYRDIINRHYQLSTTKHLECLLSAYALATTPEHKLTPIQMVPHFDTTDNHQFAVVHYLCKPELGGTAFYRHKQTGYERIYQSRLSNYGQILKQQAMAEKLHLSPKYIQQDTALFKQILAIEAKYNRAIIYPSNLLHSGCINPKLSLHHHPKHGRLTISSFIQAR